MRHDLDYFMELNHLSKVHLGGADAFNKEIFKAPQHGNVFNGMLGNMTIQPYVKVVDYTESELEALKDEFDVTLYQPSPDVDYQADPCVNPWDVEIISYGDYVKEFQGRINASREKNIFGAYIYDYVPLPVWSHFYNEVFLKVLMYCDQDLIDAGLCLTDSYIEPGQTFRVHPMKAFYDKYGFKPFFKEIKFGLRMSYSTTFPVDEYAPLPAQATGGEETELGLKEFMIKSFGKGSPRGGGVPGTHRVPAWGLKSSKTLFGHRPYYVDSRDPYTLSTPSDEKGGPRYKICDELQIPFVEVEKRLVPQKPEELSEAELAFYGDRPTFKIEGSERVFAMEELGYHHPATHLLLNEPHKHDNTSHIDPEEANLTVPATPMDDQDFEESDFIILEDAEVVNYDYQECKEQEATYAQTYLDAKAVYDLAELKFLFVSTFGPEMGPCNQFESAAGEGEHLLPGWCDEFMSWDNGLNLLEYVKEFPEIIIEVEFSDSELFFMGGLDANFTNSAMQRWAESNPTWYTAAGGIIYDDPNGQAVLKTECCKKIWSWLVARRAFQPTDEQLRSMERSGTPFVPFTERFPQKLTDLIPSAETLAFVAGPPESFNCDQFIVEEVNVEDGAPTPLYDEGELTLEEEQIAAAKLEEYQMHALATNKTRLKPLINNFHQFFYKNMAQGMVDDLKLTPEFRLMYDHLFPMRSYMATAFMYAGDSLSKFIPDPTDILDTTKTSLLDVLRMLENSLDYTYMPDPLAKLLADRMESENISTQGLDPSLDKIILRMILRTSLLILKGFVEITDPAIILAKFIIDTANAIQQAVIAIIETGVRTAKMAVQMARDIANATLRMVEMNLSIMSATVSIAVQSILSTIPVPDPAEDAPPGAVLQVDGKNQYLSDYVTFITSGDDGAGIPIEQWDISITDLPPEAYDKLSPEEQTDWNDMKASIQEAKALQSDYVKAKKKLQDLQKTLDTVIKDMEEALADAKKLMKEIFSSPYLLPGLWASMIPSMMPYFGGLMPVPFPGGPPSTIPGMIYLALLFLDGWEESQNTLYGLESEDEINCEDEL